MRQYKKRTIALVLASVVTVVGAFGAGHYSNSLMSLKFDGSAGGAVTMTVATKTQYDRPINLVKKDATTYVIMLPDTNCPNNDIRIDSGNVENVDVRTMPYTTSSNGYTKITVKTLPNVALNAQKVIYVPEPKAEEKALPSSPQREQELVQEPENFPVQNFETVPRTSKSVKNKYTYKDDEVSAPDERVQDSYYKETNTQEQVSTNNNSEDSSTDNSETLLVILGILLVSISVVYLYIRGRNKMVEILGEQPDFDINEEKENKKKQEQREKIRNAINRIDKMYQNPIKMPIREYGMHQQPTMPVTEDVSQEDTQNVVDLDELFQEQNVKENTLKTEETEDENDELTAFLKDFNFDDESQKAEAETKEQEIFNEELFDKYIHDGSLKFSKEDVEKINKLLNLEISDDTMNNISKFVVSNPIENKKPSRTEILENFITTYTIERNISFTKDDVDSLYKLMSVELDPDFIKDLRTNPKRVDEMRKEIQNHQEKAHKHSELLTLNVKNMLPDLSEALKKQGGKKIESEAKPEVVYYSEGYEVSTLSVDNLPDLTIEINNKNAYVSRPSDEAEIVASGYEYEKLDVSDELPDLNDALSNPDKYAEEPEKTSKIDEEALLKNISNVTFKPFYDGSEEIEIINDFTEEKQEVAPSVSEVQEELNKFEDFEVIDNDIPKEETEISVNVEKPISLDDDTFYDLDRKPQKSTKAEIKDTKTEELLKLIELQKQQRKNKQAYKPDSADKHPKKITTENPNSTLPKEVNIDGVSYDIVNEAKLSDDAGCYLAKNTDGYAVFGYIKDKFFSLKKYPDLKTERLEARIREKTNENDSQYIVRAGIHKFILNVSDNNMEYVMDLC